MGELESEIAMNHLVILVLRVLNWWPLHCTDDFNTVCWMESLDAIFHNVGDFNGSDFGLWVDFGYKLGICGEDNILVVVLRRECATTAKGDAMFTITSVCVVTRAPVRDWRRSFSRMRRARCRASLVASSLAGDGSVASLGEVNVDVEAEEPLVDVAAVSESDGPWGLGIPCKTALICARKVALLALRISVSSARDTLSDG
eukprot:scaffold4438_cov56-Cyclotella_meneghiniana.AAC.9